jgi:hypothetical protein
LQDESTILSGQTGGDKAQAMTLWECVPSCAKYFILVGWHACHAWAHLRIRQPGFAKILYRLLLLRLFIFSVKYLSSDSCHTFPC